MKYNVKDIIHKTEECEPITDGELHYMCSFLEGLHEYLKEMPESFQLAKQEVNALRNRYDLMLHNRQSKT